MQLQNIFKQFFDSQDSGTPPYKIVDSLKNANFTSGAVDKYASLCQISSKSVKQWQSNGELTVFKITVVHHLGFLKFKFLTVDSYDTHKRPIWHHCTKFRKDRSNHFEDVAIFVIFKIAAAAILDF